MTNLIILAYLMTAAKAPPDALNSFITRLDTLKQVSFSYRRVLDYKATSYHNDTSWKIVAKMNAEGVAPFGQFRAETNDNGLSGYDGKVDWQVDTDSRVPKLTPQPKADFFDSISVFRNSVFGFAKSLKAAVKARPDCVQGGKEIDGVILLDWDCGKARPTISVPLEPMKVPTRFRLEIDKKTWLPKRFIQYLEHDGDTIVTEFSDWNLDPKLSTTSFSPPNP